MADKPKPTFKRRLKRIALIVALAYGLYVGLGLFIQRSFMYPSWIVPHWDRTHSGLPEGAITWWQDQSDSSIEVWLLPGAGCTADRPGPLLVFAHGNGERIEMWGQPVQPLRNAGVNVLLVEYPGYGDSTGSPTQQSITNHFVTAIDAAGGHDGVDADRLILYGFSIGGGVVCSVAHRHTPDALILHNTFTATTDLSWRFGFPPILIRDRFENAAFVKTYTGPTLIISATDDQLIPPTHSRRLAELAKNSRLVQMPGGHDNFDPTSAILWDPVLQFLSDNGFITQRP